MIFLLKDPTSPSPAVYLSKKEKEKKENDITFALIERGWRKRKRNVSIRYLYFYGPHYL